MVSGRLGYVRKRAVAAVMVEVAVSLIAIEPWAEVVVAGVALNGLVSGVVIPATASMIGLETPPEAQRTVFGANASSVALGFAIGPAIGAGAAATASGSAALVVVAAHALALGAPVSSESC